MDKLQRRLEGYRAKSLYILVVSREYGDIILIESQDNIFPYSLLTPSKSSDFSAW